MKLRLDANNYDACEPYNDWLDEQYEEQSGNALDILGCQLRPSLVLFTMSPDTYEAAFADFTQQRAEEIKSSIFEEYPSLIAYYFYRFEKGYESELQRLHFLRDTWESVIDILHALAVSECRYHSTKLMSSLKFKNLFTDKIAQRLDNIAAITTHLKDSGVDPIISKIFPDETVSAIRNLNRSRNAFSHCAAQSDTQAKNWINECVEDVLEVLADIDGLKEVQIVRYLNQPSGTALRCEVFKGYSSTKTIEEFKISEQQSLKSKQYFRQGQLLAIVDNFIFCLQPMIHFCEEDSGHMTRLCVFRKAQGADPDRRINYEIVGNALPHNEDWNFFRTELNELRALFDLGTE